MSPSPSHPCRYGRSRAAASLITDHLNRSSIAPRMRAFLVPRSSLPYAAGTLSMPSLFSPYVYWARAHLSFSPPPLGCTLLFFVPLSRRRRALRAACICTIPAPSHAIYLSMSICFLPVTATPTPPTRFCTYVIPLRTRARAAGPATARTSYYSTTYECSTTIRIQFYAFHVYSTPVISLRMGCVVVWI